MFANRFGLSALLKDGSRTFSGIDEMTLKNIDNCKTLASIVQSSFGNNCMNKMIGNHLGRYTITSSCSVILRELEIQHPAAQLVYLAAKIQHEEFGDHSNFIVSLAGQLLSNAAKLIREGLHPCDIIKGYEISLNLLLDIFKDFICWNISDILNVEDLEKSIQTCINSKQLVRDINIAKLVAQAAISIMPQNVVDFNTDNIRVAKTVGGTTSESFLVNGFVITREPTGTVTRLIDTKVMVLGCGLEMTGTEAKGTVLMTCADDLINFTKGEEDKMEELIKGIYDADVRAIIVNGAISDAAQHYCNKYGILTMKIMSKFDIRRVCRTLGATALVRLGVPLVDELGHAESIMVEEISSKRVTIIRSSNSRVSTIVLRGAIPSILDEIERAIESGTDCVKCITKSTAFVAGAGATELEISHRLTKINEEGNSKMTGFDRMCLLNFADAFESIPKILAENAGFDRTEILTALSAAHRNGQKYAGVNVKGDSPTINACDAGILDHYETKKWAIKMAVDAVLTILRIDQIIMAKPAGGPKSPEKGQFDAEE